MMKWNRGFLALGLILSAACGGSDDDGGGSVEGSYTGIVDAIAKPTGTVDASSALAVAVEFEKINAGGAPKSRLKQSGSEQMACPAGGSVNATAQGSGESAKVTFTYNDCCYEATCCMNGGGNWFYSTDADAEYLYCGNYDISMDCGDTATTSMKYEGCFSVSGWVYIVRVEGQSFAVTGYYSNGSGSLDITGENGSFSCTYADGTGSCTGSGEFSF